MTSLKILALMQAREIGVRAITIVEAIQTLRHDYDTYQRHTGQHQPCADDLMSLEQALHNAEQIIKRQASALASQLEEARHDLAASLEK